jgi:tetratricopeptide (TPR) repeat protein
VTRRAKAAFVLLIAAGGLVRAVYLLTPIMDSDQAVFGLQARHVLLGEFPVFSWGYAYIGTFQSFLDALAFAVAGASRLVLDAVPLLLSLLFIAVTFRLGREVGGAAAGWVAALLVAIAPPYLAIHGAWARHGYMDSLLLGSLVLLLALRLDTAPRDDAAEVRRFAVLGLVAGVAWWTNFLSLYYLMPAAVFLLARGWRGLGRRGPWVGLGFFLLGSAPFWAFNLVNAFWSFVLFGGGDPARAPRQLAAAVTDALPAILGARPSRSLTNYLPVLSEGLLLLYAAAFGWLVWRLRPARGRRGPEPAGLWLLLLFFANAALLVGLSRFADEAGPGVTRRYLLPLYSALPLLAAAFLAAVRARSRPLFAALLGLVLGLHVYGNLASYAALAAELPAYRQGRAQDRQLFAFLQARGLTRVYVPDYWQAPRLTFDADEAIVFAEPFGGRYPAYTDLVDAAPRVAYLFAAGTGGGFTASLNGIGAGFDRAAVGPYEVFHDFRPPADVEAFRSLPPRRWRGTASSTAAPPGLAFDRDVDTAWYSGEPERPGLFFEVDLGEPAAVGKVVVLPPRSSSGFARGYRIALSRDGGRWETTAAVGDVPWSLDWADGQPRMATRGRVVSAFAPRPARYVRIEETGRDPNWWWAIGELFVYGPGEPETSPAARLARFHLDRGVADARAGRRAAAAGEYWRAARLDPELEPAHRRLADLYDQAGVPLAGAVGAETRGAAFEALGLWAKAARAYGEELERAAYEREHSDLWQRLLRAHQEARAQGETGDQAWARRAGERLRELAPAAPAPATFGEAVRLLGYRLEPEALRAGERFRLTYYWQALRPATRDYTVFVHFQREGKVRFQHDHAPLEGAYPTSRWQPGEVVRESFDLVAPPDLEAGRYEIVLGLWDPEARRRLPVTATALRHRRDRVILGSAIVERGP